MNRRKTINSLDFDDHNILNNEIHPIAAVESDILVNYRNLLLPFNFKAAF